MSGAVRFSFSILTMMNSLDLQNRVFAQLLEFITEFYVGPGSRKHGTRPSPDGKFALKAFKSKRKRRERMRRKMSDVNAAAPSIRT
jgi:hypothetical protein